MPHCVNSIIMSNIDTRFIFDEILEFLKINHNNILEEHHEELLNNVIFLKRFMNISSTTSKHGCHFTNCPWSSNLCKAGPDTCACHMLENRMLRIKKLMSLYKRLK